MDQALYDLHRLFAFRDALETLNLAAPPTTHVFYPENVSLFRRVGILCGSFNPLTLAHTELAEQAQKTYRLDCVFFTLAKVTVDKEQVTGLGLEDRLLLLSLYAERHDSVGVALVNRGLYVDQAQAFRSLLGMQVELQFIVGMDKLVQILDPKYYRDRAAALQQLFTLSSLIVANRGDMAETEFEQLLDRPENRAYRPCIRFCPLPSGLADVSATAVRQALAVGESITSRVPTESAEFLHETCAFAPPRRYDEEIVDGYAVRQRLLTLLTEIRSWAEQNVEFRNLMQAALAADTTGRALRAASKATELITIVRSL
jgi:nicotinic acid mononucleotide adenylyltransferase